MNNDTIQIHNAKTGEIQIIELTDDEQQELVTQRQKAIAIKQAAKLQEGELRLTKISAYQKLGLTEEEIEVLIPTPKPLEL